MTVTIRVGDCRDVLTQMEPESVHCCVTSPPYWGLRDYGLPPSIWSGEPGCRHVWGEMEPCHHPGQVEQTKWKDAEAAGKGQTAGAGQFCQLCGCWRGTLGLEPNPTMYCEHLVEIFRLVRRVLRKDGTVWLNLGDSYAGSGLHTANHASPGISKAGSRGQANHATPVPPGLKPKDLVGIPWAVAFALRADGWWLRQVITWCKTSPMPESVTDRPTSATEMLFLLTKSPRYFYDQVAVRQESVTDPNSKASMAFGAQDGKHNTSELAHAADLGHKWDYTPTRNRWNYWIIGPEPFPGAHFAVFPTALVEPCIKAGTSERGCCPECGSPWQRVVEKGLTAHDGKTESAYSEGSTAHRMSLLRQAARERGGEYVNASQTIGWQPTCDCNASEPIPCSVLDMFAGACTVGLEADRLGRDAELIELNPEYAEMGRKRIKDASPMFAEVELI